MLPVSYKNTSYYYAYRIGQYAAYQGLSVSVTRCTYEFCILSLLFYLRDDGGCCSRRNSTEGLLLLTLTGQLKQRTCF